MVTRFKSLIIVSMIFFFIALASVTYFYYHSSQNTISESDNVDVKNYQLNSRSRYVASLAMKKNISYEQADELEKKQTVGSLSKEFSYNYKTINKLAGSIENSDYKQDVYITVEVRYIKKTIDESLERIDEFGGIYLYLNNIDNKYISINSGDFNVEKKQKSARISKTAVLEYLSDDNPYTAINDIDTIKNLNNSYRVTTKAKTYIINILDKDFY